MKSTYILLITTVLTIIFLSLGYYSFGKDIVTIILLSVFFMLGCWLLLSSLNFIFFGKNVLAQVKENIVKTINMSGDGIIKTKRYVFLIHHKELSLEVISTHITKFNYSSNDMVDVFFIENLKKASIVKDVYFRVIVSCILVFYAVFYLTMSV